MSKRVTRSSQKRAARASSGTPSTGTPQTQDAASSAESSQALITTNNVPQSNTQGGIVVFQDSEGRYNTLPEFIQYLERENDETVRYELFKQQVEKLDTLSVGRRAMGGALL